MSTNVAAPTEKTPKRFHPYQISIAIGLGMGTFTLFSGIIPQLTKWHGSSEMSREVFEGIPGPIQAAFYTILPAMII